LLQFDFSNSYVTVIEENADAFTFTSEGRLFVIQDSDVGRLSLFSRERGTSDSSLSSVDQTSADSTGYADGDLAQTARFGR